MHRLSSLLVVGLLLLASAPGPVHAASSWKDWRENPVSQYDSSKTRDYAISYCIKTRDYAISYCIKTWEAIQGDGIPPAGWYMKSCIQSYEE